MLQQVQSDKERAQTEENQIGGTERDVVMGVQEDHQEQYHADKPPFVRAGVDSVWIERVWKVRQFVHVDEQGVPWLRGGYSAFRIGQLFVLVPSVGRQSHPRASRA